MWWSLLLLTVLLGCTQSLDIPLTPSLHPLHYVTLPAVGSYVWDNVQGTVWGLLLPVDQQDAIAIFISEGVSGFLGGIAARGIARIDGNRNNRDTSLTSGELSGAYFGTAAAIRSLAQLAGLSSFFVNLLAVIFASALSEFVKARRRSIRPLQTRVGQGPTMYDLMKFKNPSMLDLMKFAKNEKAEMTPRMKMMGQLTEVEIYADLVKYFFLYIALPRGSIQRLEDAVIVGAVTGVFSQLVRESKDKELADELRKAMKANRLLQKRTKVELLGGRVPLSQQVMTKELFYAREAKINQKNGVDVNVENRNDNAVKTPSRRMTIGRIIRGIQESNKSDTADPMTKEKFKEMPLDEKVKTLIQQPMMPEQDTDMRLDYAIIRFLRSSFECATQLVTYEAAKQYVMEVSPYFQKGFDNVELEQLLLLQSYF